jgi:hypothetical protein
MQAVSWLRSLATGSFSIKPAHVPFSMCKWHGFQNLFMAEGIDIWKYYGSLYIKLMPAMNG